MPVITFEHVEIDSDADLYAGVASLAASDAELDEAVATEAAPDAAIDDRVASDAFQKVIFY